MNNCRTCSRLFSQALYSELSEPEAENFFLHLKECGKCNQQYVQLQKVLETMNKKAQPELSPDYWERYWDKLDNKIKNSEASSKPVSDWWQNVKSNLRFEVRWAFQAAGAVAILLAGIFIGRIYFGSENGIEHYAEKGQTSFYSGKNVELVNRTSNYIQRSKVLFLGLVNFDSEIDDPFAINIPHQKKISRELIVEAGLLKNELDDYKQKRLHALVCDLEFILLQIANLEAEFDLPSIEMVKSGVERRGVLLKINIEEMRQNQEKLIDSNKNSRTNKNAKI